MLRFAHPEYLYLLAIIPLFILLYIFMRIKRKRILETLSDPSMFSVLFPEKSMWKETIKFSLILFAFSSAIVAFANPQIGSRIEEVKQIGIDVYILLDVSASMTAEDFKPNRLEKAKYEINELIKKLQGDRIGLIIFAGDAYIQFPLTTDYSAANLFLSTVDINSVPSQGTAIASAINLANESFDKKTPTKKVIVLITDGEDHEGDISAAVNSAKDNSVLIYVIGMGSPSGAPIPIYDQSGNQIGFKQDSDGNTVLTKLNEESLRMIANDGGGKYYLSSASGNELEQIYKDLASIEKTEFGAKRITEYEDKFYYFLIPALVLLLWEVFLSDRKSVWWNKMMVMLRLKEVK